MHHTLQRVGGVRACGASYWKNTAYHGSVGCVSPPPSWWWSAFLHPMHGRAPTMCFLFHLFSLSSTLKNVLPLKKKIRRVCTFIFIIFDHHSFNYMKLHIFFQFHHLTFDFYIKYVLFYNVSHWLSVFWFWI
jgi:hypothetical protein